MSKRHWFMVGFAGLGILLHANAQAALSPSDFVITAKTDNPGSSASNQFLILAMSGGNNYNVDLNNDGIPEYTGIAGNTTCVFAVAGTYTIRISGTFHGIIFNSGADCEKLLSVDQWGACSWDSMRGAFNGCTNMVCNATDAPDLSNVTDMSYVFADAQSLNQTIGHWNTAHVTNMHGMFYGATSFNQPIGNWNTANVTDMSYMFYEATSFNQPIGNWNTANVKNMSFMFFLSAFNQDISGWDVGNLTDASGMFNGIALSTAAYDSLLDGWSRQTVKNAVTFSGGNSQYCSTEGVCGRAYLVFTDHWVITDGGYLAPTPTSTVTNTSTATPTLTVTPTFTPSTILTPTATPTFTPTVTPVNTTSPTPSLTLTITPHNPLADVDLTGRIFLAFPNPARNKITFVMHTQRPVDLKVVIYNLTGERVASLQTRLGVGPGQSAVWDCSSVAPGVYLARLLMDGQEIAKGKVAIVR